MLIGFLFFDFSLFLSLPRASSIARGPVRDCGGENDRQYCAGDVPPTVYVRRHRRPVV